MYLEKITKNNRRIYFTRRPDGKLKRVSWWDIREDIKSGKPTAIKRDLSRVVEATVMYRGKL